MKTYSKEAVASLVVAVVVVHGCLPPELDWPLEYLSTFLHEAGHALASLASGGTVESFVVQPSGGGFARTDGGYLPLVMTGGYLGTTLAGSLLLMLNASRRLRDKLLVLLGVAILGLGLGLGGNVFTMAYAVTLGCALLGVGLSAWPTIQFHLVTLLAVIVGTDALADLARLVLTSVGLIAWQAPEGIGHKFSDADQMAHLTGVPGFAWAILWTGVSVLALVGAARFMARRA